MNTLLISFFLILFTSIGLGLLFHHLTLSKKSILIGEAGINGLLIAGILGNILHFFIPINNGVSYAIGFIAIGYIFVLFMKNRNNLRYFINYIPLLVLFIIFVIFFLYYSTIIYDTYLYHLQTINWNRSAALPFGLANLHNRFGFNSLWLMTASVLHFNYSSPFVINGVLFFLFCCFLLQQMIVLSKNISSRYLVFLPIGLLFILLFSNYFFSTTIFGNNLFTSPAIDFSATIIYCYLLFLVISDLFTNKSRISSYVVFIAGTLAMIKLSYLPAFVFVLIYYVWQSKNNLSNALLKSKGIILFVGIFGIWFIRSIILSGCIIFPVVNTCIFTLPWSMSLKQVTDISNFITHWAQSPGNLDPILHTGNNWVLQWFRGFFYHPYIHQILYLLLILGTFSLYYYFYSFTKEIKKINIFKIQIIFLLYFISTFLYWFILGPDIRFIQGYFIGVIYIISIPFLLYLGRYFQEINITHFLYIMSVGFLLYFALVNRNELFWILKKGNQDKWPFIYHYELQYVVNSQGIKIYYPKSGEQCGSTNLMCSNEKKETLQITNVSGRLIFSEK